VVANRCWAGIPYNGGLSVAELILLIGYNDFGFSRPFLLKHLLRWLSVVPDCGILRFRVRGQWLRVSVLSRSNFGCSMEVLTWESCGPVLRLC
jgi:hypothetical protein